MEEKEPKKVKISLGTVICIIIIILLISTLGGMYYYYNYIYEHASKNKLNSQVQNKIHQNISNEIIYINDTDTYVNPNDIIEKVDEKTIENYTGTDLVYTYYSANISDLDDLSCKIPQINMNSYDAQQINQEIIQNEYIDTIEAIEQYMEGYKEGYSVYINIKYEYYINDNILSILITRIGGCDDILYKTYNINIDTKERIFNSELLDLKNISESKFLKQLSNLYEETFVNGTYGHQALNKAEEGYEEVHDKTVSENNYGINVPMFIGEDGTINIIAKIYSLAGSGEYNCIIDTKL